MLNQIIEKIENERVIAIVRGIDSSKIVDLANALYKGGISLVEVTFNQKSPETFIDTAKAISLIKDNCTYMTVGAGTVLTTEQVDIAYNAGAKFIISPDSDQNVVKHTVQKGMVSIPGAYTASEAKTAHQAGAHFVKLFPCMDASYLKAIKAPLSHIKFLAVGGVNDKNAIEYINAGAVGVGVGSSLVNKKYVENGDFDKITKIALSLVESVKGAKR